MPRRRGSTPAPPASAVQARGRSAALVIVAVTLVACAGAGTWWWWRAARVSYPAFRRTPDQNVLVITVDTLRADALSLYGGRAASPTLTALARAGVTFDFAHAHAVMTLPSHTSILTGRYPYQHGVRDNSGYRVPAGTPTLATLLKTHGFETAAFVGGFPLDSRFGLAAGFDMYDDRLVPSRAPTDFSLAERRADAVVGPAVDWIRGRRGKWFAWVHVFDAHAPYRPPPPFDREYADSPYHGEVAWVDHALAPLVAQVSSAGSRPTLVIVTADHGEALGDHGELTHGLFAYESTLRVPLVVAQVPAAQLPVPARSAVPVSHVDLAPTVLHFLGIEAPAGLAGRSLLAELSGNADPVARHPSYFEAMSASLNRGWAPLRGVLDGRRKLVDVPVVEAYDLERDPGEHDNLADRERDTLRLLQARLAEFGAAAPGARVAESHDVTAQLRSLGYVSGAAAPKAHYTEADDPKRLVDLDRKVFEGVLLAEAGRWTDAAVTYRAILAQRPDMTLAWRHLGYVLWEQGRPAEAIAALREALAHGAVNDELRAQLGVYLAETGSPADAIALLGAGETRSEDVDVLNALGVAYARAGDRGRALATYERIFAIDPTDARAHQNIGAIHLEAGDLRAARAAFERALAADPQLATAHTGLGVVELRSGHRAAAIGHWRTAVSIDPEDFNAIYNLASELARGGDVEAARPLVERFAATAPPAFYADDIRTLRALVAEPWRPDARPPQ